MRAIHIPHTTMLEYGPSLRDQLLRYCASSHHLGERILAPESSSPGNYACKVCRTYDVRISKIRQRRGVHDVQQLEEFEKFQELERSGQLAILEEQEDLERRDILTALAELEALLS